MLPKADRPIEGGFVDNSHLIGHRLRDGARFDAPAERVKVPLVIVGGGVAGLSAAWWLNKRGFNDFVVLELEDRAGGNSRWGENDASAYPWAAHYVPVPGRDATLVRLLFEEMGVLRDGQWDERHLCFTPQERLFLHGRWQEGLEPAIGLKPEDRLQFERFEKLMAEYRASGCFTIPMERGERASLAKPAIAALDTISASEWMRREKFTSPYLQWYVNYACRDDYGATAAGTSAWAGVHYFASREHEEKGPLTWPEGNGWIIRRLLERLGRHVRTGTMVHRIAREGRGARGWRVFAGRTEYAAAVVIFAAPTFMAPYIIEGARPSGFAYSPWLTANLTLDRWPRERGIEPAWDNVIYGSPALGYVVATHQTLRTRVDKTVWTFYWALADGDSAAQRALLLQRDWNWWKEAILADLARAHPDIRACVRRIDIMRMGHAMARPVPGFLASPARRALARPAGTLFYANSDVSGLSLFEEAQYRGVTAATAALRLLR